MLLNEHPFASVGFSLAALAYFVFFVHLLRQGYSKAPHNKPRITLLVASALTVVWAVLSLVPPAGSAVSVWSMVVDMLRYAGWFAFVSSLVVQSGTSTEPRPLKWLARWALGLPALGVLALFVSGTWAPANLPGVVYLSMMLMTVFGLVAVEQLFRNLPEDALWSAKPICLGLAAVFLFDLYVFSQAVLFGYLDIDAWGARGVVAAGAALFFFFATSRHQDWLGKIRVSRQVVFHSTSLLLVGLYLLLVAGVGYYIRFFGEDWGRALQLTLVFLGLVLLGALLLSRSLRARLRVTLGKHFFRYRYDYREEWLKFTQALSNHLGPQEMGQQVIHGLADMVESPGGSLWLLQPDEGQYRQVALWNTVLCAHGEPIDAPLMGFMRKSGWVVNLDELAKRPALYEGMTAPAWMSELKQPWLVVPLMLGADMMGFVVLSHPRIRVDVNWEVIDLLKTAGKQAASFLTHMQATEALMEARKFEAFNRMSAFVVHDLKNIVTQLSLMVKNAKRLQHNPEFQADMLMTVENALDRMRQLMLQLREGAAPSGAAVGVQLTQIAQRLADAAQARGRAVALELHPKVMTRGHPERMERVVGHLVSNALDATEANGRVWVQVQRFGSHAQVVVGDSGVGMSADFVKNRLFKPFQSTKGAGMGIGLYESRQYVQELGGKMTVESHEGEGTVITLLLPLIETFRISDFSPLEKA